MFTESSLLTSLTELLGMLTRVAFSAQLPDTGGGGSGNVGSVGHLVAAAMQTAGVYAQSRILESFAGGLERLAALCYLCSIAGALLTTAIFGNYQKALYLLLGPPLFFFMVTTTHEVKGTPVQEGKREAPGSVTDQLRFLKAYGHSADYESANVSFFFWGFDNVVSSVVQGVVSVLTDTENKESIVLKTRERVLSWALLATPSNPGFVKLVSLGAMGECAEVTRRTFEMLKHRKDPTSRKIGADNLDTTGLQLLNQYNEEKSLPRFNLEHEIRQLLRSDPGTQKVYSHDNVSCQQIWEYTHDVARQFADKQLSKEMYIQSGEDDGSIPWDKVMEEVKSALDAGGNAQDILAAYIIKNTMGQATHSSLTSGIFNRVPFNAGRSTGIFDEVAGIHRYGGFLRIQYFAKAIPYIQGLLLYMLSISFPFFAVFLVMPNRAGSFMIWASLWVWVKSWDIGFALVSVARKILWQFVKAAPNKYDAANVPKGEMAGTPLDWTQPQTLFAIIADNDPLATQNTYFTIVGILTAAVPLITAHFCLGAGGLWDVFAMSLNQRTDYSGTRRMKQRTRADQAGNAENLQAELTGMAAYKGAIEAQKDLNRASANGDSGNRNNTPTAPPPERK